MRASMPSRLAPVAPSSCSTSSSRRFVAELSWLESSERWFRSARTSSVVRGTPTRGDWSATGAGVLVTVVGAGVLVGGAGGAGGVCT